MYKYFVMTDGKFNTLFMCDKETVLPTSKMIVERLGFAKECMRDEVKEISKWKFARLLLWDIITSLYYDDLACYTPNDTSSLPLWRWWDEEEI